MERNMRDVDVMVGKKLLIGAEYLVLLLRERLQRENGWKYQQAHKRQKVHDIWQLAYKEIINSSK